MQSAFSIDGPPPGAPGRWSHPQSLALLNRASKQPPLPESSQLLEVPRERALAAVRLMPGLLSHAGPDARDDRELALAAVAANALVFADLSERLRDDEAVVIAAATGWQWEDSPFPVRAWKDASPRLRRDLGFLDRLLRARPDEYDALDEDLQCDPAILERVFGAPNSASWLLGAAPDAIRRDPKWAGMAIEADPFALQHAQGDILDDYDVGMRAVKRDGRILKMLSSRLCDDDAIARAAIVDGKGFPSGASDRLRDDEDYIVTALAHAPDIAHRLEWTAEEVERHIMQRGASPRVKAKLETEGRAPVVPDLEFKRPISDEDIPF